MKYNILWIALLASVYISAQTFSSRLIDAKTKKGIAYATIQFGKDQGVITNEEGKFSFVFEGNATPTDSVYISSMGYAKTSFSLGALNDSLIMLQPRAIELSSVYVFDKELDVNTIIERMKRSLEKNMNRSPLKQRYFLRQSEFTTIEKIDFGFEKSSIAELNKAFIDSIALAIPRQSNNYTETLGDFHKMGETYKINVLKAAELYDKSDVNSFEDLGQRMETMFKKNIKPDSYLKIKSGLFSQKVDVEEVLEDIEENEETSEDAEAIANEIERDTISGVVKGQHYIFHELLSELFYEEDSKLDVVEKSRKYDFDLVGYSDIDESGVYVIDFRPSGGAVFQGRMFINIEDFAVLRIEFENVKNLRNFRLLGIFFRETVYGGSMQFERLSNGRYDLSFADLSIGNWFRVDRPLDVIEKNKNVKGRRKQNELRMNIDFRMKNITKWELVVFKNELISEVQFENVTESENVKATYMPAYDPDFWKGYTIMEPNSALRSFSARDW